MSWQPSTDPELGDRKSCDALDLVIVPRMRDIGAFSVHRALPHEKRRMVGPFIFFDQMGPATQAPGQGMDVRPHPHIGLATVTYLFNGAIRHRDSEGNIEDILPGAMNLMTAGSGIAHSERTPDMQRRDGQRIFGIQSWVALPAAHEETAPGFQHFAAESLPLIEDTDISARIIAGQAFGAASHVKTLSDWFYVDVMLAAGAKAPLDPDYEERAIYVAEGEIELAGKRFEASQLLVFKPGQRITVTATKPSRLMFLGGAALEGPRHIWWNFVSSSKERIEQAKEDWKQGRFKRVPNETEFIPLPDK
ncbi:MAG: pirin family protein [Parvibaculum sp.]|uniref:pirin family protein n=1 Tax=Parvibaculum sp. TaxID=2024848 RepID=UPI002840E8D9|nr:pirin family protein [Parvibaculum sp.]MDR3498489.1 pirin family protein [Parvibaculum sp.]